MLEIVLKLLFSFVKFIDANLKGYQSKKNEGEQTCYDRTIEKQK